jgi:hypothetical protein
MSNRPYTRVLAVSLAVLFLACGTTDGPSSTPDLVLTTPTLSLTEGEAPGTFGVALSETPDAPITFTLQATAGIQVAPTTIEFSPDDIGTPTLITVTPLDDEDVAGRVDTIAFLLDSAVVALNVVTTTDDDAVAIVAAPLALNIAEGDTGTVMVRLSHDPGVAFGLLASVSEGSDATVDSSTVVFLPANYDVEVPLRIAAGEDHDIFDDQFHLVLTSIGGDTTLVLVTVDDDDTQQIVVSPDPLDLNEGETIGIMVNLAFRPVAPVTVSTSVTIVDVITAAPANITFDSTNYGTPVLLQIGGVTDPDAVNDTTTLRLSAPGANPISIPVSVQDVPLLVRSTGALPLTEGGAEGTIGLSLDRAPDAPTPVTVISTGHGIDVGPGQVTFTPGDFATPKLITVWPRNDDNTTPVTDTITFLMQGGVAGRTIVTTADDDEQAILLAPGAFILDEGDSAVTQLSLAFRPQAPVTVRLSSPSPTAVAADPDSVVFTPANYAVQVPIRILALEDVNTGSEITVVRATSAGLDTANIGVRINDDDHLEIILDDEDIPVAIGDSGFVHVSLNAFILPPTDSVVVTIQSQTPGVVSVGPATVTFTAADFATPVPVKIKRLTGGVGIIRLTAPNYDGNNVVVN